MLFAATAAGHAALPRLAQLPVAAPAAVLTWVPQVQALVSAPFLLEHPSVTELFPGDAIARAKKMLGHLPGGVGAYSDSRGAEGIRQEVAEFITRRDGHPASANVSPPVLRLGIS